MKMKEIKFQPRTRINRSISDYYRTKTGEDAVNDRLFAQVYYSAMNRSALRLFDGQSMPTTEFVSVDRAAPSTDRA